MDFEYLRQIVYDAGRAEVCCARCGHAFEIDSEPPFLRRACPSCHASSVLTSTAVPFPTIGSTLGDYLIERELGRGGTGVVFLAFERASGRRVALKVLKDAQTDPRRDARFFREARAAALIRHAALVEVYEVGVAAGRLYIAMEFLDGATLRRARLTTPAFVAVLQEVALGLHQAHVAGIVHRDVKPENILLDASGAPRLVDFGVAQISGQTMSATREGRVAGTLHYMAPEHLRGEKISPQLDVYALGVLLYEHLAGRPPFVGEQPAQVLSAILAGTPNLPSRYAAGVDPQLEAAALRAMDFDAEARYPTARDFADELGRWCHGRRVKARLWRPRLRASRSRLVMAAKVACVLAMFGLVFAGAWWWRLSGVRSVERSAAKQTEAALARYEQSLLAPSAPVAPERDVLRETLARVKALRDENPAADEILLSEAQIESRLGRSQRAIDCLDDAIHRLADRTRGEHFLMRAFATIEPYLHAPFVLDAETVASWRQRQQSAATSVNSDLLEARNRGVSLPRWREEFVRAFSLLAEFRIDECSAACEAALSSSTISRPERADVLQIQGVALLLARDLDGACRVFERGAEIRRSDVRPLLGIAIARVNSGGADREAGLAAVERIFTIDPENDQVWLPAACLWGNTGAEAAMRGEDPWAFYERAHEAFERALAHSEYRFALQRLATLRCTRAHWLSDRGRLEAARAEASSALLAAQHLQRVDPSAHAAGIVGVHSRLNLALWDGTDPGTALELARNELSDLLIQRPNAVDLLLDRARTSGRLAEVVAAGDGDPRVHWREAERDLTVAIQQHRETTAAHEEFGRIRWARSRWAGDDTTLLEAAESDFTRALEIDSQRVSSRIWRGAVRRMRAAAKRDVALLRAALHDLEAAVQQAPRNAEAHAELGDALFELTDLRGAATHYQRAVELDPKLGDRVAPRLQQLLAPSR